MAVKILVDETSDGLVKKLLGRGYIAEGVKKLKETDERMAHDYNVIEHAKKNDMIVITKDGALGKACNANNIKCILLDDDLLFEIIVLPNLKKMDM